MSTGFENDYRVCSIKNILKLVLYMNRHVWDYIKYDYKFSVFYKKIRMKMGTFFSEWILKGELIKTCIKII